MITVKKLLTLKERTRKRKIAMILQENAHKAKTGIQVDVPYLQSIIELTELKPLEDGMDLKHIAFKLEDYGQVLLSELGAEPSDWDFTDDIGGLDKSRRTIQDKVLVLDRLRSPYNVGAVFRSADSFGISRIILVEGTASPEHMHARRTSRGTIETVDWCFMTEEETVEFLKTYAEGEVMALELGGEDINTFAFPVRGVAVLGSEEFGVSPEIMKCCTAKVSIPMAGTKGSLNVSVAAGIFMQCWFAGARTLL